MSFINYCSPVYLCLLKYTHQRYLSDCKTLITGEIIHLQPLCKHSVTTWLTKITENRLTSDYTVFAFSGPMQTIDNIANMLSVLSIRSQPLISQHEAVRSNILSGMNSLCLHLLSATFFFCLQLISIYSFNHCFAKWAQQIFCDLFIPTVKSHARKWCMSLSSPSYCISPQCHVLVV